MRKIFVISAPTNGGKTTLMARLMSMRELELHRVVTTNSRPPRPGEIDGVDYHFVTREKFEGKVAAGEFVEWAHVHNDLKGVERRALEGACPDGGRILMQLDIQGYHTFKRILSPDEYKVIGIFLEAPSLEVLLERWRKRADYIDPVDLAKRTESYYKEMAARFDFEYCVMNDDFEKCVREVVQIIKAN